MHIVFTLCSINYLAQAKTLGDSVLRHNPGSRFIIGLIDKNHTGLDLSFLGNLELLEVEKVGIHVDDAPFLAVEMVKDSDGRGRLLRFRTNVDDWVTCDSSHRLRFEAAADGGLTPYLHVRAELWAKVTRALYYDLVDMGEERVVDGRPMFGVASSGEFFAMADAAQVRGAF